MLASMVCGQIALSRGERDMWFQSPFIVLLLVISVLCFAAFLWWDSCDGNQNPVFHVSTIPSQCTYSAAFGVVLLCGIFLGAGLYVIPRACWILQSALNRWSRGSCETLPLGSQLAPLVPASPTP
jgi:MFS transporter, DHA2 family, multidrug resistance protein